MTAILGSAEHLTFPRTGVPTAAAFRGHPCPHRSLAGSSRSSRTAVPRAGHPSSTPTRSRVPFRSVPFAHLVNVTRPSAGAPSCPSGAKPQAPREEWTGHSPLRLRPPTPQDSPCASPMLFGEPPRPEESVSTRKTGNKLRPEPSYFAQCLVGVVVLGRSSTFLFVGLTRLACLGALWLFPCRE